MPMIYTQRPPCPFTAQTQSTASRMHTAIIVSKQGPCLDCWHNTLPWAYIWWLKPEGSMKRQMISSCEFHCQLLLAVLVSIDGWYLNSLRQNLAMKHCVQVNILRSRSKFLRQSSIDPVHLAPPQLYVSTVWQEQNEENDSCVTQHPQSRLTWTF